MFFVRFWRHWCIKSFKNIEHCVTTNCYWGLEINAHAIVNFIVLCRDRNYDFDITLLQSQTCESFFRASRSFTSTESTVVNFDMKSFESRLNKIEAKVEIMHRRKDDFKFPRLRETSADCTNTLPSNIQIAEIIEKAKNETSRLLHVLGVPVDAELFGECIYIRKPKEKHVNQVDNFEFVSVYEDIEEADATEDEPKVYDVNELLANTGPELQVKDSRCSNERNIFKIKNKNGKIVHVKKSTFIWMLKSDISRVSTDRLNRFKDTDKSEKMSMVFMNEARLYINVGEWILMDVGDGKFLICKVYEFTYLTGKKKTYSRFSAPVHVPAGITAKGIGVKGAFFDFIRDDNEYRLELNDKSDKLCYKIENYKTHLEKPVHASGLILYCEQSANYIDSLIKL